MRKLIALNKWLKTNGLKRESLSISSLNKLYKYAVSRAEIADLKDWLDDDYSQLSFDELFKGKLRLVIPFNTKEDRQLLSLVPFLKETGWLPAGRGSSFNTKKVKQKMRRPDTGEEYEEEVEVADLKISKEEKRVIPAGPRKGEEITREKILSISKVLSDPKNNAPVGMADWWKGKQTEYTRDYNWKQIESVFKDGDLKAEHSIIISRDPIDVLRMSDYENIRSCHSEHGSYFNCAISESRGNGLVAYLVKSSDLEEALNPPSHWSEDAAAQDEQQRGIQIGDLDGQEIFADRGREVLGVTPKSRVRLRKYVDTARDYEFAAPENRTYGPHPPGFIDLVRNWAWQQQKHLFENNGEISLPNQGNLQMHGGSYRDTYDGDILNSFFEEGCDYADYRGNVTTISSNEESTYEMWVAEIEEILEDAEATLEHVSFSSEVDDDGEGNPYLYAHAYLSYSLPLYGWEEISIENRFAKTNNPLIRDIPVSYDYDFEKLFDHPEGGEVVSVELNEKTKSIDISIEFSCDSCYNPDDVEEYFEYIRDSIDSKYLEYVESVRRKLVAAEYIEGLEFDRAIIRLEDMEFENFVMLDVEEDESEIKVNMKPKATLFKLQIPYAIKNSPVPFEPKDFAKIFDAEVISTWVKSFRLNNVSKIIGSTLDKLAAQENQDKLQLRFDFLPEPEASPSLGALLDVDRILTANLFLADTAVYVELSFSLQTSHTNDEILLIEKFIKVFDENFHLIGRAFEDYLAQRLAKAGVEAKGISKNFFSGELAKPIIERLKKSSTNDVRRLATWIEANWNVFSNAEKDLAYNKYLLPTERYGDYIHDHNLDWPNSWNSEMQKRKDTDIGYRWNGLSMKDVSLQSNQIMPEEEREGGLSEDSHVDTLEENSEAEQDAEQEGASTIV